MIWPFAVLTRLRGQRDQAFALARALTHDLHRAQAEAATAREHRDRLAVLAAQQHQALVRERERSADLARQLQQAQDREAQRDAARGAALAARAGGE